MKCSGVRGGDTGDAQGHLQIYRWNLGALQETKSLVLLDAKDVLLIPQP